MITYGCWHELKSVRLCKASQPATPINGIKGRNAFVPISVRPVLNAFDGPKDTEAMIRTHYPRGAEQKRLWHGCCQFSCTTPDVWKNFANLILSELHRSSVKCPPLLIILVRKMAKRLKLCERCTHFPPHRNSRYHTTVLNADVPNCYTLCGCKMSSSSWSSSSSSSFL